MWPSQLTADAPRGTWPAPRLLTHDGRTMRLNAWAAETGLAAASIRWRLARGWSIERALTTPKQQPRFARHLMMVHSDNRAAE